MNSAGRDLPIAVDLDGTLLKVDTLHEGVVHLLTRRPWMIFVLILWMFRGKAAFKQLVTNHAQIDVHGAPVNSELLEYLEAQKRAGRRLGLFSAADQSIVSGFAERFNIFDVAVGSDGRTNLSGKAKLCLIQEHLGPDFVYAGDAPVDLPIWRSASGAILVGRSPRMRARVARETPIEREFLSRERFLKSWLRMIRSHQWAKNLLVFIPGGLALPTLDGERVALILLTFAALSAVASATYIINDLVDLAADRAHRSKKSRPLASGAVPLSHAVATVLLLSLVTVGVAILLPTPSRVVLLTYVTTTLAYSFGIKRIPMLDVLCLGFLFTLRIAAGAVLLGNGTPYWLFAFSMFFFTSLAFVKRYTELLAAAGENRRHIAGRGYQVEDLPIVLAAGLGTALCSLVVFLIYLGDQHFNRELFSQPMWLGLAGGVLAYWLLRIWLLSVRDRMHDDPVLFALKDRASLLMGLVVGIALLAAW